MASQQKSFVPLAGNFPEVNRTEGKGVVGVIAGVGESCAQVKIQTMSAAQTQNYGFRFGKTGALLRLNQMGEVYELTGEDEYGGVTLESMPDYTTYSGAEPALEVAYSAGDGGPRA